MAPRAGLDKVDIMSGMLIRSVQRSNSSGDGIDVIAHCPRPIDQLPNSTRSDRDALSLDQLILHDKHVMEAHFLYDSHLVIIRQALWILFFSTSLRQFPCPFCSAQNSRSWSRPLEGLVSLQPQGLAYRRF